MRAAPTRQGRSRVPMPGLGIFTKARWRIPPTQLPKSASIIIFGGFQGLAQLLNCTWHRPATDEADRQKGDLEMSGQSQFVRTLTALAAALLVSSVTVSAAVGPAQAVASPVAVSANA